MREEVIGTLVLIAIMVAGAVGFLYGLVAWQCSSHETATGTPTKVVAMACYLQVDGVWLHWNEYKLRFATKGATK